jgi:hypothetical protein
VIARHPPSLPLALYTFERHGPAACSNLCYKRDPSPAQWKFTVTDNDGNYPETWINWVRATPGGKNIPNGGSTTSTKVVVDFQGMVAGKGSHIDLKIDSGSYVPVESPHTVTGLSDGPHTIYLKAVDKDGKADSTPAKWRFTVINDDDD